MRVPITGTVKKIDPYIGGEEDDPIRIINVDLGPVRWNKISIDLENEEMIIEVTPIPWIEEDTGQKDENNTPIWERRALNQTEKDAILDVAKDKTLDRMSKDDLYTLTGDTRLKNPFKANP